MDLSIKTEVKNTNTINTIVLFSNSVSEKNPITHPMKQTVPINKAIFKITIGLIRSANKSPCNKESLP